MAEQAPEDQFLERVNTRLTTWRYLWILFLVTYFVLGATSVSLSAISATDLVSPSVQKIFSVTAAVCVALLGFLRPDARYRNLIRAWRELDAAKMRYQYARPEREYLLMELARTERLATDDQYQGNENEALSPNSGNLSGGQPDSPTQGKTSETGAPAI